MIDGVVCIKTPIRDSKWWNVKEFSVHDRINPIF